MTLIGGRKDTAKIELRPATGQVVIVVTREFDLKPIELPFAYEDFFQRVAEIMIQACQLQRTARAVAQAMREQGGGS